MSKYVVINSDGTNSFYDSTINTIIPSTALSISDTDYNTFFNNPGSYIFEGVSGVATLTALTTVYFATDYGTTITTATSNTATPTGATKFTSSPTTAELESAFPTTAGSRTYTIATNAVSGDTITICGVTLTAGTSFTVGSDANTTATNIATALNSNEPFATIYKATVSGSTITVTEVFAGDGNTPAAATYTGTVVISSGTAVTSVKGYDTAVKLEKLTALDTEYQAYSLQYDRAYTTAVNSPVLTDAERTANLTAIANARTALITSRTNGRKSIING